MKSPAQRHFVTRLGPAGTATTINRSVVMGALAPSAWLWRQPRGGSTITVEVTCEGGVNHDLVIEELDEEVTVCAPGETETGPWISKPASTGTSAPSPATSRRCEAR